MTLVWVSGILALVLTMLAGVPYLDFLKKHLYSQYIREEGPASHSAKSGTPTTGGMIIVIPAVLAALTVSILRLSIERHFLIIIISFILFITLGFSDDYAKISKKHNTGISGWRKLAFQSLIALLPAIYVVLYSSTSISIFGLADVDLGWLYVPFAVFLIVGASNAVNLTDGLDGLAAGTCFIAFAAITIMFVWRGMYGDAIASSAIAGSCLGFLWYNRNPAQMFMGDTGSIALGGVLGTIAVLGRIELWLVIIGAVFVIETLSVIIQVISFKTTGKRVFKMSPIHHHFELSGWSERKVVYVFWAVGALCAAVGAGLYYVMLNIH